MSCGGREIVVYEARCKDCGAAAEVTRVRYVQIISRNEAVDSIVGTCTLCGHMGELDALYGWCAEAVPA